MVQNSLYCILRSCKNHVFPNLSSTSRGHSNNLASTKQRFCFFARRGGATHQVGDATEPRNLDQIWQMTLYQSLRLMSSAPAKEFYQQCCGSACPTWGTRQPQGRDSPQAESHGDTPVMIIIRGWVIMNKMLDQETRPDLWKKMSSLGSPLMNQSAKKTSKQY